jgi:murein DD-endopeptidase MepM/ murein hydrolase activator NlpD
MVESLESRQLLCYGTNPEGYVPTVLTAGHDHFIAGGLEVQQTPVRGGTGEGGAPNLALTDVYMADSNGDEVATPAIGSYAYMVAHFTTENIPSNTTYTVRMTVAGQNIDYDINWGSGAAGTGGYVLHLGVWLITSGFKNASVTLDANNDIAESSGLDNTGTTNFAPAFPSTKFIMPIEGTPWLDWTTVNYVDLALDATVGDYQGGSWAYDGHNGWDLTTANWRLPDGGLSVYAAAPGTVVDASDGNFDRVGSWSSPPPANFVTIDHGNGFRTTYYHLRKYSVGVDIGDTVVAGQQIGLVGSSGRSTNPHLHFGVYYNGMLVEPNVSPTSYFSPGNTLGYAGDHPTILDAGIIDISPTAQEWYEGPPTINTFNPGDTIRSWAMGGGAQVNDDLATIWYRPDGVVAASGTSNLGSSEYQYAAWTGSYTLPANAMLGTWQLAWLLNGVEFKRLDIGVRSTALPAEVQMTETDGTYIKDGRTTPFDLGEVWEDTPNTLPTFSFRVRNRGSSTLTTSGLNVPAGFSITDGLAASITAGSFDTVTLRLDDQTAGWKIGYVTFSTSDGDPGEDVMSFRVEGRVNGVTPMNLADDPDTVYIKRSGANTRVWINRSTALSPTSEFPVAESANWVLNTGLGNDTVTVDFSEGNPLQDTLDLDLGTGTDTLRVIGTTGDDTSLIGASGISMAGRFINFAGLNALSVDGDSGDDLISLNFFSLNDDLDLITFPVSVVGGIGSDSVIANDTSDTVARNFSFDHDSMTRGGSFPGLTYSSSEVVRVNTNDLASIFTVNSTISTTVDYQINAGGGNDTLNVGSGDIGFLDGDVTFDGEAGTDRITVNDSTSGNVSDWTIESTEIARAGFGGMTYANAEALTVLTSQNAQVVNVLSTNQFASLDLRTGGGADTINIVGNFSGDEVTVSGGAGADNLTINGDGIGIARARLTDAEDFATLTIANGGGLIVSSTLDEGNALRVTSVSISGNGYLDLVNNPMIIDHGAVTPIENVRSLVQSGYAGGAWNGPGIRASAASGDSARGLGYVLSNVAFNSFPASFAGQSVDATSILLRYTQKGDTDLDREVDFDDLLRLAQNYGVASVRYWYLGDFNYDTAVNFDDLLGLAQQYNTPFAMAPLTAKDARTAVRDSILS